MTTATDVSICSNALLMVGAGSINSLSDATSDRQKLCVNLYPTVRGLVLSSHPWNCCRKRVQLTPETDAAGALRVPAFDWSLMYTLPPDFVRLLAVGEDGVEVPHAIEWVDDGSGGGGVKILCDDNPLLLRYCFENTNVGSWSPLLVAAMTHAMRAVLAYPITSSTALEQVVQQEIAGILKTARGIDSADVPPETLGDFRLLNSRYSSAGFQLP